MQLADAQVMTIVIAIVVPLSLLTYSNSRITDAKETLRAETAKLAMELRSEMNGVRNEIQLLRRDINAGFERMETALKIHVLEASQVTGWWLTISAIRPLL
jgi:hypothetical protein